MTPDPLWRALVDVARRAHPRYAPAFGLCPLCGLGATDLAVIEPLTWAACSPCEMRWPASAPAFVSHDDTLIADDARAHEVLLDALAYEAMCWLAGLRDIPVSVPGRSALHLGGVHMRSAVPVSPVAAHAEFDPDLFLRPGERSPFGRLSDVARRRIGGAVARACCASPWRRHRHAQGYFFEPPLDVIEQVRHVIVDDRTRETAEIACRRAGVDLLGTVGLIAHVSAIIRLLREERAAAVARIAAIDAIGPLPDFSTAIDWPPPPRMKRHAFDTPSLRRSDDDD